MGVNLRLTLMEDLFAVAKPALGLKTEYQGLGLCSRLRPRPNLMARLWNMYT